MSVARTAKEEGVRLCMIDRDTHTFVADSFNIDKTPCLIDGLNIVYDNIEEYINSKGGK